MVAYDIIGDIHGCYTEFEKLTIELGYDWSTGIPLHPNERKLVFLGDLTDRGPNSVGVMELVWRLNQGQTALYTPGNHCDKLFRYLKGNKVQIKHGLETTVDEINELDIERKRIVRSHFLKLFEDAPLYLILDDGKLVVAHAGIREEFIGTYSGKVKTFVRYGDITGKTNADGTPERRDWAKSYKGKPFIVYGHTPVSEPRLINNTCNIDTGAVFGGKLTAFRYPEMETFSISSSLPYTPEKFRSLD